ncbi:hypothetical protein MP638_000233 [Amoeboaphelidium occidentale]|nr:hypothetical protein MP638_000233 [Amoeboaphelidium occidentale]
MSTRSTAASAPTADFLEVVHLKKKRPSLLKTFLRRASVLSAVGRAFGAFGDKTPEAAAEFETSEKLYPLPPTPVVPLPPTTQALLCPPTTPEQQFAMEAVLVSTFSGLDQKNEALLDEVLCRVRGARPMFDECYRLVPLRPFAVCSCIIKKKDADGNWELGHKQLGFAKTESFLESKWVNQLWFRWIHEDA